MRMLEMGLVNEVRALGERGDLNADMPSMRCVGYRQTWAALVEDDLNALPERGIAATRQLAKRQLTWLRGMPHRQVVVCDAPDVLSRVTALAVQLFSARAQPTSLAVKDPATTLGHRSAEGGSAVV